MPSPCWGPAVAPGSPLLPHVPVLCLLALPSLPPGFFVSGRTPALRFCYGCSWRLAVLAPQGLSLSVSLSAAFSVSLFLAHSALFALCPLWIVLSVVTCPAVMSFVSSRPNSPCWLHLRTPSLWASPESWGQPVLVAVLLLQFQVHLWLLQLRQHPQRLLQRPRPVMRWRPLCCVPRHSGPPLPGLALALAHLRLCRNALHGHHVAAPVSPPICVALLPSRSRDWSRAWPPRVARQSHLPSCAHVLLVHSRLPRQNLSHPPLLLDPPLPQLLFLRPPVLRSLRPTPMTNGTHSLTHTVSLAPRPPSPSRLLPLELVGVLATSVADVSARQPSAPCGEIFNILSPVLCAFSAGAASLAAGFVLGMRTLPRVMWKCSWTRSFPAVLVQDLGLFFWRSRRWLGRRGLLGNSEDLEEPNKRFYDPRTCLRVVELFMVASLSAKGLHRCRLCCSWTSPPCQWVWRRHVVS